MSKPQVTTTPIQQEIIYSINEKFSSEFVTGVIGGLATNGTISINFFRDKLVLPDKIFVEVENGKGIREVKKIGGKHIKRDVFFEAILDIKTTKVLIDWLLKQVTDHELKQVK